LDGVVRNEGNAVQLAKLLSTCLVVRGSQLSILRRLSSPYIVQIQTNLITWITKKIAGYEKNKNKKGLKTAIAFFRVLIPLLNALPSPDALKVYVLCGLASFFSIDVSFPRKAHMDQTFEVVKVEILPNMKLWEPQRAYEKRLSAIMAKENRKCMIWLVVSSLSHFTSSAQTPKVKRTRKKAGTGIGGDDTDGEITEGGPPKGPPRRTSRRVTRSNPDGGLDESTGDEEPPAPVTPKAKPRPRPRPRRRQATPSEKGAAEEDIVPDSGANPASPSRVPEPQVERLATPQPSRKRPRSEEREEEEAPDGRVPGSPEEPEIEVRRKRVRH
jgi:cohesin complex subunit SA-1/2